MPAHPPDDTPDDRASTGADETNSTAIGRSGPVGLIDGAEPVGDFLSSGYREPPKLVQRSDGQLVRLPEVLYVVAKLLDEHGHPSGDKPPDQAEVLTAVAAAATRETGLPFEVEHIVFLMDRKLAPLGVSTYSDGTKPEVHKPTTFLSLRIRMELLPATITSFVGGLFAWLFLPAILVTVIAIAILAEYWVFATQDVPMAIQQTLLNPYNLLAVVGLAVVSTVFHEVGHAAACRYSGVTPGGMGCGIYLVWPAFYTDINNSYRLSRGGRLRTDLGGVYFNVLSLLALVAGYMLTEWTPLLVAVLSVNIEIIQQLLPTLRFDGYYIVSDLVGIPDLFKYIGPILKRVVLRREPDERLSELKRWPQNVVTIWVLLVLPALVLQLGYIAWQLPRILRTEWFAIVNLVQEFGQQPIIGTISSAVQVLLLLLPAAGLAVILYQLTRAVLRFTRRRRAT